ncbi:MAG TPA: DUF1570 domain-containing protein [Candidatus Sulfotelmatobacter sp.]|nr:DUF1570 domain-containing protein [Candidatus Sulfotelmatobacter sp.]
MSKRFLVLLPLALATLGWAREHTANWVEVRSPRFTIVTNSSEKQGRRIAVQFERMRAIFQEAYPQLEDDPDAPVVVLAIKNKDEFRALQPSAYASKKALPLHGMFVGGADKNYILMRLDSEAGNPYPVVYHEYTHLFLREADERMPLWLNEGLAEFYQSTEIYDQEVLLGEPNQQHLMFLRQEKLLPLATLFTVDEKSPYYLEEKKGAVFYAECWALTHYLTLKDYGEKTSKVPQYIALVNENVDPVTAATRVFGDLRKLQRSLEIYIEQNSFNHFETRISRRIDDSRYQVKSMSPAQAAAVKAEYLAASGRMEQARGLLPTVREQDSLIPENIASAPSPEPATAEKVFQQVQDEISCPLSHILEGASERATEMVENLQRFTATEKIEHTEFRKNGKPRYSANQVFSYVAEIDQASGSFWVEEYRSAKTQGEPPPLSDTGTAAFALIFHPQKIGNFEFHCEARTEVKGISAWQLRFEESPDPRKSFHQIRIDRSIYQLRFKGRAWIAADDYQILRLQTDLVAPISQIHLQQEHLDITYAPVDFDKRKLRVWLPENASMQIRYRGHSYQRVHNFSHFQLFLVVTEQTVKEPIPGPGG